MPAVATVMCFRDLVRKMACIDALFYANTGLSKFTGITDERLVNRSLSKGKLLSGLAACRNMNKIVILF